MNDEWYCDIAGREIGPLSARQLREMAERGQILPSDCVRRGRQGLWTPAQQVKGLFAAMPPQSAIHHAPPPPLPTPAHNHSSEPESLSAFPTEIDAEGLVPSPDRHDRSRKTVLSIVRQRQERQKKLFGAALVVGVAVVAIALLLVNGIGTRENEPERAHGFRRLAPPAADKYRDDEDSRGTLSGAPPRKGGAVSSWVDATRNQAAVGDASLKIASVVKAATPSGVEPHQTGGIKLLITVEVRNADPTRKIEFLGWTHNGIPRSAQLTDNFGNRYRARYGPAASRGQAYPLSLYPHQSVREVLAFEPPVAKAAFLQLELSEAALGGSGTIGFKIPAAMIADQTEVDAPPPAKTTTPNEVPPTQESREFE